MKFCLQATVGLEIDTIGRVRPCCLAKPYVDETGNEYNLKNHSLDEIWNSEARKNLLSDLNVGIENPACEICWIEEKHGRDSKRIRENAKPITVKDTPQILDLKLGNTCNLQCRTCNPDSSSAWVTEWYEVNNPHMEKSEFLQKYKEIREIYSESNNKVWDTLAEWIPKCPIIDFYGGEPILVKKTWEILKNCVDSGHSINQEIHYNTNCTIYPSEQQIETIKHFKQVNISLSIDGIEEQFEFMRFPAKWNLVLENIRKYSELMQKNPNIFVDFCYTVSIYNIWDVVKFDAFVKQNFPHMGIYYNMLFSPTHVSITNIPENIKPIVEKRLLDYSQNLDKVSNMIYSNSFSEEEFNMLWEVTERHDKYRNNKFEESFSEWHSLLIE